MTGISFTFIIVLVVYLSVILGIAVVGYRRTHTEEDFLTASRSIGPWVGGAVLAATQISAGSLVGTVGRHYATGVSWVWVWPGLWCGWFISAVFVAPKLREFSAVTIPDFLAARYNSQLARALSALLIIVGYMILLVAQYQAFGDIFQSIFGIRPIYAMMLIMVSTFVYTMLGGVRSSSYIDFLQILIVLSGLLFAVIILVYHGGGFKVTGEFLTSLDPRLTGWWYNWKQILGFSLAFGLAIAAAPYEMVRFYSMRDKATVRYAIGVSFLFQAFIGSCLMILGIMIRAFFPNLSSVDQASSIMTAHLLPPVTGALFLVVMVSAVMSNINSILIVTSAGLSHDIYGKMINPQASEKRKLALNRLSIFLLGTVPVWFALQQFTDVQSLVVIEVRFVASFFFIPIVVGLNSRRGSSAGAICSMLGGLLGCLLWSVFAGNRFPGIDAVEVGIATSAVFYFVVSRFTPPVPEEVLKSLVSHRV